MKTDKKYKILIAEDDTSLSLLLRFRLEEEGYRVFVAHDGKEAIEKIDKNNPDMVISDIMMPLATGLEVVNHIRYVNSLRTPIILLSNAGLEEIVLKAFKIGLDDFISKPFVISELLTRVKMMFLKTQFNC